MRGEADLDRHLGNGKEPELPKAVEAPPVPPKKDSTPKVKDKDKPKDEAEEAKPPFELAGKDDYQLAQAVNLLKGLQILQNNAK